MSASCLPAHATKHFNLLSYPFAQAIFHLSQLQDGVSNGTALWLGGQCLAAYLAQSHVKFSSSHPNPRAIELGSGIGLTACATSPRIFFCSVFNSLVSRLSLSALGWDVVATDIPYVITSVLSNNIRNNQQVLPPGSGRIVLRELDWFVEPEDWLWDHPDIIATRAPTLSPWLPSTILGPPYDLICTADTIYDAALVAPLLRSLHAISTLSTTASPNSRAPSILLCLERRDPTLIDRFMQEATTAWNFSVERVPYKKLAKAVQKQNPQWSKQDWEGVELWKLGLITSPRSVDET